MEFIKESNKDSADNSSEIAEALKNTSRTESNGSKTCKEESPSSSLTLLSSEARRVVLSRQKDTRNTPTLGEIGRQVSLNFRNSQFSDSGAESCCDNDEQARLLRTPSTRSQHQFIIIPATASTATDKTIHAASVPGKESSGILRQTISSSALNAMSAAIQQKPSLATSVRNKPQQQYQQKQRPLSTASTSSTFKLIRQLSGNLSDADIDEATTLHQRLQKHAKNTSQINSKSADVINQPADTTSTSSVVRFTLDEGNPSDYVNAQATTPTTSKTAPIFQKNAITTTKAEINNTATRNNNKNNNCTSTDSPQNMPSTTNFKTSSSSSTLKPLDINVSGQPPINESMRSASSANALSATYQASQFLQPPTFLDGGRKELSASACLFPDQLPNQIYSDLTSVRSLASIGIGSTDGRRLVIRRVPTTPNELFSLVHPPSSRPQDYGIDDDDDSFIDDDAALKPRQQKWGSKMQFVLACIGYSVGLGNVWRFPYMCYKSGGGVFLVPYCIILVVCSIPLLYLELAVGQYTGRGPIGALGQLCPLFKGAGLASVIVSFLMSTYYSVIIAYSIYYFFTSFKSHLPWIDCDNRWNTPDCWIPLPMELNATSPATSRTPSEEFFENKLLQISPGIEYPGMMRWELFVCLIAAWIMVYFATWKSIKSSAKVRYFTATFPFILIIILMGRAVTLEGSAEGLRYFFRPNWSELKRANVWINAASQNFNSIGITFGSMISFASYNKYNNNILRDTVAVSVTNIITSLLVGIFAFATLGNLALEQNTNVRDVIGDGPGLIFVVYPQAMAKMPFAQLWAVMFFFMLLCLGLNTQFAIVEVVVTSIQDGFPRWIKRKLGYHEIVVLLVCCVAFLFGLPNIIQGGIYFFQLMDHYTASVSIMFLAFCQLIAVAWLYGVGRLSKNIKQMTGKPPSLYLLSCWTVFGPCLLFAIWVLSLINYREPSYHNGRYQYPCWAYAIGWMFASFSLICIPAYAIINYWRAPGNTFWERLFNTLRPNIYECKICGEHHCEHDFPEQEQFMLEQEMAQMYKPSLQPTMLVSGQNRTYTPMMREQQQQQPPQQHQQRPRDQKAEEEEEKKEKLFGRKENSIETEDHEQDDCIPTSQVPSSTS